MLPEQQSDFIKRNESHPSKHEANVKQEVGHMNARSLVEPRWAVEEAVVPPHASQPPALSEDFIGAGTK